MSRLRAAAALFCAAVCADCSPDPVAPAPKSSAPPAPHVSPAPGDAVIQFLEERVRADRDDVTAQNRLAGEYLRRFRRSGDDADLVRARAAADASLAAVPADVNPAGLQARARASLALHGFQAARDDALVLQRLDPGKRYPFEILGDALLELGDLDGAAEAYAQMAAVGTPDVATESRHARLALVRGDLGTARRRFDVAILHAETRRAESPETLAWCHVQAGQLAFSTGDWDTAETHYTAALDAAPGDWGAEDHVAELRAAERRFDESIAMYEALVARVPRPELLQALGDVYAAAGRKDDALKRHRAALAAYRQAADAGSAHYFHHLAGYLCDVEPAPAEAVTWARKDLEVRTSSQAWDGLAWALHLAGDSAGAAEAMEKALAQGTRDAHVLYHASLVFHRAGNADRAREMLRRASEENPRFNEFHVHR